MGAQQDLEKKMEEMLVKKAPFQIPEKGRKWIAQYLPIIVLIIGILSVIAAISLFSASRTVNEYADEINAFSRSIGEGNVVEYGFIYYLAVTAIVIQAVILLMAYKPLKEKAKKGWDLLLLGVVISFVYNVLYLFTDSGFIGNFIFGLIGTLVGLYVLAQIRSQYAVAKATKK